jgi:hypothetical protein
LQLVVSLPVNGKLGKWKVIDRVAVELSDSKYLGEP